MPWKACRDSAWDGSTRSAVNRIATTFDAPPHDLTGRSGRCCRNAEAWIRRCPSPAPSADFPSVGETVVVPVVARPEAARHAGGRYAPACGLCSGWDFTVPDRGQNVCARSVPSTVSGLSLLESGDPGWTRTSDLQLRRLLLYPLSYGASSSARAIHFAAVRKTGKAASIYATGQGLSVAAKRHPQNNGKPIALHASGG
jgi:hypothetical protein